MSTAGADHGGPDLSHLHPSVRESALLGLDERLPHLRADRWIGYTRATTALQRLETPFSTGPASSACPTF